MSETLVTISASAPRRVFGVGTLLALGAVLVYLALGRSHAQLGWQLFLLGFGILALVLAERMRRVTAMRLVLTEEGLFDSEGRELARVEEITGIERGMFAMKPSNGFVLRLKSARGRLWAPGLYWRFGRRLGVGGVTAASQTKVMSEVLTALMVERADG